MATRPVSLAVYFVGLIVVLAAFWVLFTQTGLEEFIPMTVAIALVLLIVGIAVMASSDRFSPSRRAAVGTVVREDRVVRDRIAPETQSYERVEEERRW